MGLNGKCFPKLERQLASHVGRVKRGPTYQRAARFMLFVTLMRLCTALPLRLIAGLFLLKYVTLWRYCNMVISYLSGEFKGATGSTQLIADTTSTRVRCTDPVWYSGYKKQRVAKVQVLCDSMGRVHCVSAAYPGSVHDKTIWNAVLIVILGKVIAPIINLVRKQQH